MPFANKKVYNAYMREYMINRYHDQRGRALSILGNKCKRCGNLEDLEFDHVDPRSKVCEIEKLFTTAAWDRVEDELDKCQLLCKPCHTIKTNAQLGTSYRRGPKGIAVRRRTVRKVRFR